MQNDELNLRIKAQTTEFNKELDGLNVKAKALKTTLQDIEKTKGVKSEEYAKAKKELQDTEKAAAALVKQLRQMDVTKMSMKELNSEAKNLAKEMNNADRSTKAYADAAKRLGEVERELAKAKVQAQQLKGAGEDLAKPSLWQKITGGVTTVGGAFKAIMALQIIGYIFDIGKAIFNTTGQFEKYEKTLESTLGSQKASKDAMLAIRQLAKELPQTVEQLTEGYIKLTSRGLRPGTDEMKRLTDFSLKSGKSIEDLSEAIMDINNQERWSEFGVKVKTSGDKIITTIGGVKKEFDRTEQGAMDMAVALGGVNGTMGLAAKQMQTLGGAASNVEDGMTDLMLMIGDKLKPVFVFFLNLLSGGIEFIKAFVNASTPLVEIFEDLFVSIGDLIDSFLVYVKEILPSGIKGFDTLGVIIKVLSTVVRATLVPFQAFIGVLRLSYDAMAGFVAGGKAVIKVLTGDFAGAAKDFESSKTHFSNVKDHAIDSFSKIRDGFKKSWTDRKTIEEKGSLDTTKNETKLQGELTKEQKKGIDDRKKAYEEALNKIAELEDEAFIAHVKRTQGEVAAEKIKLQQKADAELLAVYKSLATAEQKAVQERLIITKLQTDLEKLEEQHQKETSDIIERWTDDIYVQKIKKAQTFANTEMANARKHISDTQQLADIEKKINEHLKNEIAFIKEEQANDTQKKADDTAKKEGEISKKKLDAEKFILQQETEAYKALFDFREMEAKGNVTKLLKIQKDRLSEELRLTQDKLKIEQQTEELEAKEKIKDQEALDKALLDIQAKYQKLELIEVDKTEKAKTELTKKAQDERLKIWKGASDAFSSLLKGDLNGFVDHINRIVKTEQAGWQKRLSQNQEKFAAVAQMAQAAVSFLNDLAQKKAERAIAEVQREYDFQKATIDKQLSENKDAIEKAEEEKKALKEASSEKIKSIKEQEEAKIKSLEDFYRSMSSADAKMDLNEQIDLTNQEAEAKIEAAKKAADEAKSAAREARDEKIIAAEAARDAEINSINQSNNTDKAAKAELIARAKAKAEQEISIAKQEYESKVKLSADETKAKIEDATQEKADKIELMKQLQTADKEKAKQLIENAKQEAKEKVAAAEKEKNEKLKIVEQEKAKRVQEKKDLEEKMHEEDKKAKQKEYELKLKAWKAQQKADIASALIGGALAVVKALSAGFPLGLVMAAVTAVMTGIQIAKIKNQAPPAMPSFATGGLVDGPAHGTSYGTGGLAIIHRKNNREVAEMEGGEWIVDKHQTAANLPLLRAMKAKTLRGDRTPLAAPVGFRDGGAVNFDWTKRMYRYGGRVVPMFEDGGEIPSPESVASKSAAASAAEGGETANADRDLAKKQAEEQLENQKKQLEELMKITKRLEDIENNTSKNVGATNAVEQAVKDSNTTGKFDSLIGAISKFGGKAA